MAMQDRIMGHVENIVQVDFREPPKAWNLREVVRKRGIPRGQGVNRPDVVTSIRRLSNDNAPMREFIKG